MGAEFTHGGKESGDVEAEVGPQLGRGWQAVSKGQVGSFQDSPLGATWGEKVWYQGVG